MKRPPAAGNRPHSRTMRGAAATAPALTLPHRRAKQRRFVLEPLAEIAPKWRFPDSGTTVLQELNLLEH